MPATTPPKCEGKFGVAYSKVLDSAMVFKKKEECDKPQAWRLTYLDDIREPINCCEGCLLDASVINILYSAVRLESNK